MKGFLIPRHRRRAEERRFARRGETLKMAFLAILIWGILTFVAVVGYEAVVSRINGF